MWVGTECHAGYNVAGEPCRICEATVPFSETVHVLVNARGDEGVVDYYVCRSCYDEHLAPLFPHPEGSAEEPHE